MADGLDFSGQAVPVAQPKLPDFSAQATPVAGPAAPERIPSLFERAKPFLEKTYPVSDLTDAAKQIVPGVAVGGGEVLNLLGRVLGSKAAGYATQNITQNPVLQTLMGGSEAPENARQSLAEAAQSYLPQDVEAQQNLAGAPKTLLGNVVRGGSEMVGPLATTLATPELSVGKIGEALPFLEKIPGVAKYLDAVISQAPRAATQTAITQAANPNATPADDAKALAINAATFGLPAAAGAPRLARAATGAVSMPAINAAAGALQGQAPTAAGTILSALMGGAVGGASRGEPFNPETLPEVPEVVPNTAAEAKPTPEPAPQAAPAPPAVTPEDIQAAAAILGRGKAEPLPEPASAPETTHQPPIAPAVETVAPQPPPNAGTPPPERPIAEAGAEPAAVAEKASTHEARAPLESALGEYGYSLDADRHIVTPEGKTTSVVAGTVKQGRISLTDPSGRKLWSGAPQNAGDFLESFWFAKKQTPAPAAHDVADSAAAEPRPQVAQPPAIPEPVREAIDSDPVLASNKPRAERAATMGADDFVSAERDIAQSQAQAAQRTLAESDPEQTRLQADVATFLDTNKRWIKKGGRLRKDAPPDVVSQAAELGRRTQIIRQTQERAAFDLQHAQSTTEAGSRAMYERLRERLRASSGVMEHAGPADISSNLTPGDHAELDRLHTESQQQPTRQPEPPVHAERLTAADHAEAEKLGAEKPVDEVAESDLSPQDQELVRQVRERQAAAQDNTAAQGQLRQESVDRGEREAGELGLRGAVVESLGPGRVQRMHFVHDEDGLPQDVIKRGTPIKKGNVRYGLKTAEGEIYIFTKHANTPERAVWTAWHEHGHRFVQEMVNAHPDVKVGNRTAKEAHESARRMFLQNPTVSKLADVIAKQRGSKDLPRMAEEAMVELHAAAETGRWDEIARKYGVEVPKAVREGVKGAVANFVKRLTAIINAIHGKLTGKPRAFSDADVRDFLDSMRKEPEAAGHGDVMEQQVFHGSPHRGIEKEGFKLNKIGTGEGAQAYGWGMYFAGKKEIAEAYRSTLGRERIAVDGKPIDDYEWDRMTSAQQSALKAVSRQGVDKTLGVIDGYMDENGANLGPLKAWRDAVEDLRGKTVERVNDGQLYHAEIPEDKDLLDWDKPLSEQPEGVRAKLEQIGSELPEFAHEQLADGLNAEWRDLAGKEVYQFLSRLASEGELPRQAELTADAGHPDRAAAEWLNAQGIPGLRYADANSRGPDVTYNVGSPRTDFGPYSNYRDRASAEQQLQLLRKQGFEDAEIREVRAPKSHNYVIWDEAHLNNDVTPYYSEEAASPEDARRAVDELRNEGARFATADQQEAFTLVQWARHALTHGMSLDDLKAVPGETPAERIKYLADRIGTPENPHGFDTRAAKFDFRGRGEPPAEGQAAAVPEGEGKETAPRNAAIDEAREARELEALPHAEREHWETPLRKALAKIADDPAYPAKLAAEVATKPRSLTTAEVMALTQDLRRLNDDHANAVKEVIKARESGDANAEVRAVLAKQQAEGALTLNHEALRKGGTEAARSLSIRNAILKEDYSLGRNMDRAKAAYGEHFTEDVRKRVEELSQRLDEQEKTIEALRRRRTQPRRQSADEAMQAKLNARIQKLRDQVEARQKACPI